MTIKEAEYEREDNISVELDLDESQGVDSDVHGVGNNEVEISSDDEVIVSIGEESPTSENEENDDTEKEAPRWVKELRKSHKQIQKENRELKEKLKSFEPVEKEPTISNKPTLEDCEYDTDVFEEKLTKWYEEKKKVDEFKLKKQQELENQNKQWQDKLSDYENKKKSLKVKDYEDAEEDVRSFFDVTQQGIIISGSDNPALLVYAIGKNKAKLEELAKIKDPIKFTFAIAKLETQLKVSNKKAPPPEKVINSNTSKSGTIDSTLERLRAEADKTGDYSKVFAYKKQLKSKT